MPPAPTPPPVPQFPPSLPAAPPLYPPGYPAAAPVANRPLSSAVLAGWIFVGLGVCTFWLFGLGFYLIGLGAICGVVAMCTHQIKAGLLLLVGSVVSAGLCVVLIVVLALGVLGAVGSAAQKAQAKAEAEARAHPIPKALPVDSTFDLESQFRREHKELSGQIENSLRPVIQQLEPPATPSKTNPSGQEGLFCCAKGNLIHFARASDPGRGQLRQQICHLIRIGNHNLPGKAGRLCQAF